MRKLERKELAIGLFSLAFILFGISFMAWQDNIITTAFANQKNYSIVNGVAMLSIIEVGNLKRELISSFHLQMFVFLAMFWISLSIYLYSCTNYLLFEEAIRYKEYFKRVFLKIKTKIDERPIDKDLYGSDNKPKRTVAQPPRGSDRQDDTER